MRPELWQELTAIWPCAYNTVRCVQAINAGNNSAAVIVQGTEMTAARDAMRNSMTITVNGNTYPVIVDDGINELDPADNANILPGEYASSVYLVPLTIVGGFPVTYMEYVDYRAAGVDTALAFSNFGAQPYFWTDNGAWSWAVEATKWCYKLSLKTERRIILRTPQLAGRIDHIRYSPLQHLRDSDPDSSYFRDGGPSTRPDSRDDFHAVWNSRHSN
jgi:hypothetical protein